MEKIYKPNIYEKIKFYRKKIIKCTPHNYNIKTNISNNRFKEYHSHKGFFKVFSINPKTNIIKLLLSKENLIMTRFFNYDSLPIVGTNTADDVKFKHCGIGDDNTAPTSTDTTLGNEVYRVALAYQVTDGAGEAISEFYITDTEFSGDIEELGIFSGNSSDDWNAGAGADTGELLAHILWSHTKTTSEEILIQRTDTYS